GRPVAEEAGRERLRAGRGEPGRRGKGMRAVSEGLPEGAGQPLDRLGDLGNVVVRRDDKRDEHLPRVLRQDRDAAGMREDPGQDATRSYAARTSWGVAKAPASLLRSRTRSSGVGRSAM